MKIEGVLRGREHVFNIGLPSQTNPKIFQANPTIAAGDFKVSKDDGSLVSLATTPTVSPASGKVVKVTLSATEMNAERVTVVGSDAAGDEWCDVLINIVTSPLLTVSVASGTPSTTVFISDLTSTDDDFIKDATVLWLTGNLRGEQSQISAYDGTTNVGEITVSSAFSAAPSLGDVAAIVGKKIT